MQRADQVVDESHGALGALQIVVERHPEIHKRAKAFELTCSLKLKRTHLFHSQCYSPLLWLRREDAVAVALLRGRGRRRIGLEQGSA